MSKTYYSKSHEYVTVDGEFGLVGISDYAQHQLGNVVYVDLPEVDSDIAAGEEFGGIESVKAASDLFSPVTGQVVEVNELLIDNPRLINDDPMNNWIVKVHIDDPSELEGLMDEEAYKAYLATL